MNTNTNTNTAPALREALEAAQRAINSMKVEAETAAQGDEQMMLEACEQISNEGLAADMAIRQALSTAASPHVQIPQENVHVPSDVSKKAEQLDTSGPAVATKEMLVAAVKYVNGGDIYEKLPLEVLEIEESIYGEIYWVMAEAAPKATKATKATKAEPVQPERAPLSDEQIDAIFDPRDGAMQGLQEMARRFARKIERHHGIQPAHKEQPNG